MIRTLDFHITPHGEDLFCLEIIERDNPQRLLSTTFSYKLSLLTDFELSELDSDSIHSEDRFNRIKNYGMQLYNIIFSKDVEGIWRQYKKESDFLILCIRTAPECRGLEALAWETLWDGDVFIAAGEKTGLTRLPLDISPSGKQSLITDSIKMAAFISSPLDLEENGRLQMEEEQLLLLEAVNEPASKGNIELEIEDEAKIPILKECLKSGCHIFHYSGHGNDASTGGGLLLEDKSGNCLEASSDQVAKIFKRPDKSLRLVVLSSCQTAKTIYSSNFTGLAHNIARHKIPGIVAMQFSISDRAGLIFARHFYAQIAAGQPLELALTSTRRILLENTEPQIKSDAFAPVLIAANGRCLETSTIKPEPLPRNEKTIPGYPDSKTQAQMSFFGRRREVRIIRDSILKKNTRAILIHGIEGTGKTELAKYAAHRMQKNFEGVCFIDCSDKMLGPELISVEIHKYLESQGIMDLQLLINRSLPPKQLGQAIGKVLKKWPVILIMDGFEPHLTLVGSEHQVAGERMKTFLNALLGTVRGDTVFIITSSFKFLPGSLSPDALISIPMKDLNKTEALGLIQRLPNLTGSPFLVKEEIVNVFGGHPLSLILLDKLCLNDEIEDILTKGSGLESKLKSQLKKIAAVELIYTKLSENSRKMLDCIAAFKQPVMLDAADWVMKDRVKIGEDFVDNFSLDKLPPDIRKMAEKLPKEELEGILQSLVPELPRDTGQRIDFDELINLGLVTPYIMDDTMCAVTVHRLIRDFCREKQGDELWALRLKDAAKYCMNKAKLIRYTADEPSNDDTVWKRIAFELYLEAGDFEPAARQLLYLHNPLNMSGFTRYLEVHYTKLLSEVPGELNAEMRFLLGNILSDRRDYEAALVQYREALGYYESIGDVHNINRLRCEITLLYETMESSRDFSGEKSGRTGPLYTMDAPMDIAMSYSMAAQQYRENGQYDKALKNYKSALSIYEKIDDKEYISNTLRQIGNIFYFSRDYQRAEEKYREAIKVAESIGYSVGIAKTCFQWAGIFQKFKEYDQAIQMYRESAKFFDEVHDMSGVAMALTQIGNISHQLENYSAAMELYRRVLALAQDIGDETLMGDALYGIGHTYESTGNHSEALEYLTKALSLFEKIGTYEQTTVCLSKIIDICLGKRKLDMGLKHCEKLIKLNESVGNPEKMANAHGRMGVITIGMKNYEKALNHYLKALHLFSEIKLQDINLVIEDLMALRSFWGEEAFDNAWKKKTGGNVPAVLKN